MINAAVIGLGNISQTHISVLQKLNNVEICAVCDIEKSKAGLVPNAAFYESASELLKEAKPDVVHICLPHYLHYPIALLAAQNGANVFCEKPLALNAGEANAFANLETNYPHLKFGVCFQNRYNASTIEMLNIIKSQKNGKLLGVKGIVAWCRDQDYYSAAPWRGKSQQAGGGVMINQAIHTLDIMQLFGGKIQWIKGSTSRLLDFELDVEDTVSASIMFANGAKGLFLASNAYVKSSSVEIELVFENAEYLIKDNHLLKIENGQEFVMCQDDKVDGAKVYYGAGHGKAILQFYTSIENNTSDYIKASQGVVSLQIIDAIHKSSQKGEKVIF